MRENGESFNAAFDEEGEKKLKALSNRKLTGSHRCMETVKCECGAEILLLPDVKAMGRAIELHVTAAHMQKSKGSAEADSVRDALMVQVLCKACKSEDDGSHKEGS